eukprot:scaffold28075_cov76-Amphora_coffeaeformis.AAC.1
MNPSEAVTTPVIDRNRTVNLNGSTVEGEFHQGHRRLFHDFGRDIVNKKIRTKSSRLRPTSTI